MLKTFRANQLTLSLPKLSLPLISLQLLNMTPWTFTEPIPWDRVPFLLSVGFNLSLQTFSFTSEYIKKHAHRLFVLYWPNYAIAALFGPVFVSSTDTTIIFLPEY